jgi:hypothetical protein
MRAGIQEACCPVEEQFSSKLCLMKRFCDDDSAATSVKVVYRQASYIEKAHQVSGGLFCFGAPLLSRQRRIHAREIARWHYFRVKVLQ